LALVHIDRRRLMQEELLTFEREFTRAVADNDAAAIRRFIADDWVIVDADGGVIGNRVSSARSSRVP